MLIDGVELETGWSNGDLVAYTGKDAPDGMMAFVFVEGHKAGQTGVCATPETSKANTARIQREWKDQQAGFARLHNNREGAK